MEKVEIGQCRVRPRWVKSDTKSVCVIVAIIASILAFLGLVVMAVWHPISVFLHASDF